MRLIDAKAGKKMFNAIARPAEYKGVIHMVVPISEIDKLPTIDAVPVAYGQWSQRKGDGALYRCSECGEASIRRFKFCPECGANMDGGNEDA